MKVNWDRVKAAIEEEGVKRAKKPLARFDLEDAVDLVRLAANKWLDEDLRLLRAPVFEVSFRQEVVPGVYAKGVLDVFTEHRPAVETEAYLPCVIDWKTRQTADVDSDWARDLRDSAQWRIYAWASRAPHFFYRGLSRRSRKCREVPIQVPEDNDAWVENYLRGIAAQHVALTSAELPVWPQVKPRACRAWGRDCERRDSLRNTGNCGPPEALRGSRDLSYTAIERFLLCPERYRCHALAPDGEYESDDSLFGSAFHAGAAEAWRQAFQEEN